MFAMSGDLNSNDSDLNGDVNRTKQFKSSSNVLCYIQKSITQ